MTGCQDRLRVWFMENAEKRRGYGLLASHRAAVILTALGLALNVAYILNSYLGNAPEFFRHFGNDLFDHIIILLMLPLLFVVGYLIDRSRATRARLEEVLARESYISQNLQSVYYPKIAQINGYSLAARYRSVLEESELGGDYYDVFDLGGGRTALTITDVSGKGLAAAMMGAFVKSVIRAYLRERSDLPETVARISSAVYREQGTNLFVTAFIAVLDERTGAVRYVNAGHPGPVRASAGDGVRILPARSMPLGVFSQQEFTEEGITLEPGDHLVLYTDGLYEFRRGDDASPETVARDVFAMLPSDADSLAEKLLAHAESLAGGRLDDDVAVVVISRDASARTG